MSRNVTDTHKRLAVAHLNIQYQTVSTKKLILGRWLVRFYNGYEKGFDSANLRYVEVCVVNRCCRFCNGFVLVYSIQLQDSARIGI